MGIFNGLKLIDTPISAEVLLDNGYLISCHYENNQFVPAYDKFYKDDKEYYIQVTEEQLNGKTVYKARHVIKDIWSFYNSRDPHYHELKQIIEYESDLIAFEALCRQF